MTVKVPQYLRARLTEPQEIITKVIRRNGTKRIINDSLFIKVRGTDPVFCWDSKEERYVYLSRRDWEHGSPALTITDIAVLSTVAPDTIIKTKYLMGIKSKKGHIGRHFEPEEYLRHKVSYYSIEDAAEILSNIKKKVMPIRSELDFMKVLSQKYVAFKQLPNGEFVPIWSETI